MKNKKMTLKYLLSFFLVFFGGFLIFILSPLPENNTKPHWFFYDKNGEILYQEKFNSKKALPLQNIENLWFTKALILLEDENFKNHYGVNFSALLRATKQNITEKRVISGASTITMQLAKNLYLPYKKHDFWYKIQQIFYGIKLEVKFSKSEILQKYIDNIYFGNNTNGLKSASQKYFSKSPQSLSLGESLTLLSIIQNPSLFNPIKYPEENKKRRKLLLKRLKEKKFITDDQKRFWEKKKLTLNISINNKIIAPHFIFWTQKKIQNNTHFKGLLTSKNKNSEIHVYTTLDKNKYQKSLHIAQKIREELKEKNIHNAAIIVLNQNQELEVMLGSPDFFNKDIEGAVNLSTAFRQTGSVLKPFLYALALEKDFSPLFILKDEKQIFESGYFPRNFHIKEFNGKVYFREALANSYNIAAVYLLNQVGLHTFFNFTQKLGLNFQQKADVLGESFILGSGSESLLNLTRAYSVFKNKGEIRPIKFFTEIKNKKGQKIFSWQEFCKTQHNCKSEKIISKNSAEWITHALSDKKSRWKNFEKGNPLELPFPAAVKTGTSQNFIDNWVIGFSSQKTIGVWVGNANGTPLHSSSGIEGAGPLWHKIMISSHENLNYIKFDYTGTREEKIICRDPKKKNIKTCSEVFTTFLTTKEFKNFSDLENKDIYIKLKNIKNQVEKDEFKIIYPRSGGIFMKNTDILIQTSEKNTKNLTYFLNNQKINSPIIKNLKSGKYYIRVENNQTGDSEEILITVE